MKKIIKKLLGDDIVLEMRRKKFQFSKKYKYLKKNKEAKKLLLLDTPEFGNLGDHAIALAEKKLIMTELPDLVFIEFTHRECNLALDLIEKYIAIDDIITIHGGGFLGTLWPNEQQTFLQIVEIFRKNKIIVFPQTVFFEKDSDVEIKKMYETIHMCDDIRFFLRDKSSHKFMEKVFSGYNIKLYYVPDIVTYLTYEKKIKKKKQVLLCLRGDREKIISESKFEELINFCREQGYQVKYTDTVIKKEILSRYRGFFLNSKLKEFAHANLVVTDRLHGMLFSTIVGTPCIALDNISHKVSGQFEWIKVFPYVIQINETDLNKKIICEMLNRKLCYYNNEKFNKYYDLIADVIGG